MTDKNENQWVAELARDLISQTAPQELPLFRANSQALFTKLKHRKPFIKRQMEAYMKLKIRIFTGLAICASLIAGCGPLIPQTTEVNRPTATNICDPSGCYLAWNVIDSDEDGVCDADELMAGTNPHDPLSLPQLIIVAELGGKRLLPSFEAGRGAFFIYPVELQEKIQASKNDPLSPIYTALEKANSLTVAFPLGMERADTLSRLGISTELLKQHNIDVNTDGFTLGFDMGTNNDTYEPMIGGMRLSWYSDDDWQELTPLYPNSMLPAERIVFDKDKTITELKGDFTMTEYKKDRSGEIKDSDGKVLVKWYVDPNADSGQSLPTLEKEKAILRARGAAIHTLENWHAPGPGDIIPTDEYPTLILVDPDYLDVTAIVLDAPRVTTAQPEVRPDLPNPGEPANPGKH